jgi:hypothetical protein
MAAEASAGAYVPESVWHLLFTCMVNVIGAHIYIYIYIKVEKIDIKT